VKTGLSVALALPLSALLQPTAPGLRSTEIVVQMGCRSSWGRRSGFVVLVAVATIQAVGTCSTSSAVSACRWRWTR
jgi:flagellar biosynthesis protein FliR